MQPRRVIVHYHILKNAGTTVDAIFRRALGAEAIGHIEGPHPWTVVLRDELSRFIQQHAALRVASSHQARLPTPEIDGVAIYPVLFLRNPIDRAGSVYEYERALPADSPSLGAPIARERPFSDYVRWRLQDGNGAVIRNFQVVHLAARMTDMRTAIATGDDLAVARARLAALPVFGLVERFDASLSRMDAYLRPAIGASLAKDFQVENRSPRRKSTLNERLDDIRAELGEALYQELIEKNEQDLRLYAAAQTLFEKPPTFAPPS
jgi:hypothetical protein